MLQALRCCCPRNQAADEKAALEALRPETLVGEDGSVESRPATPRRGILKRPKDRVITPRVLKGQSPNTSVDVMDELHAYRTSVGDVSSANKRLSHGSVLLSDVTARLEELSVQSKSLGYGGLASSIRNSDENGVRPASVRSSLGNRSSWSSASLMSQHSTPRTSVRDIESMDGETPRNSLLAYDSSLHNLVDALFVFCPMAEWSQVTSEECVSPLA